MDDLITWINSNSSLGILLAIGALSMLESLAFVGILVPGIALLATLSWFAGQQALPLPFMLLSGFIGAVIGDWLSYLLGRYASHWISTLAIIKRHPNWLTEGQTFFSRYGGRSIFLGRFIGPIRAVTPFVAGSCAMPPRRFLAFNLLSAACWAPVSLLPAYWLGQQAEELQMSWNIWLQLVALLMFVAVLFQAAHHQLEPGNWLYRYLHPLAEHPHRQLRTQLFATCMLTVLLACIGVRSFSALPAWEQDTFQRMQNLPEHFFPAITLSTLPGDGLFLALGSLSTVLLLWLCRQRSTALGFVSTVAATMAINTLLKLLFDWPRPALGQHLYESASFPSGHAAGAAALLAGWAVLMAHRYEARTKRRIYLGAFALIAPVALSRVLLGVHWPLDVIAGSAVGLFFATLLRWQMDREVVDSPIPTAFRYWLGAEIVVLFLGYAWWRLPAAIIFYTS
ncbi:phosphatase PAP2 family protein [Pontibacterium granulatum]|uniref:phosphatase PAP2 family protein n=1 Tax=Pontibacterium granulatum TaxID=2036029 RepID=UPI00249B11B0|nr:phosphatase PAP2 family protein [Pontibacterium granulatum]MDI3323832.1 phosphatase PAP2 family protein [Pontibacterium granulatum]